MDKHINVAAGARDEGGRFRVAPGSSTLHAPPPPPPPGLSMRNLEAQARVAEAERAAKRRRKAAEASGGDAGRAAPAPPVAPDGRHAWLRPGLVVKHAATREKWVVTRLLPGTAALAEPMVGPGQPRTVEEAEVETVIPARGGRVVLVAGRYTGEAGALTDVDIPSFKALVRIVGGARDGMDVEVEYEEVCKTEARA